MPDDGDAFPNEEDGWVVGFRLKEVGHVPNSRIVLNRQDGFAAQRIVPDNEWKKWPVYTQELKAWEKGHLNACQDKVGCKEVLDRLYATEYIKGVAYEYKLTNGSRLKYVQGGSKATKAALSSRPDCSSVDDRLHSDSGYMLTRKELSG